MKIAYFASDSYALSGPSIVNRYYREYLESKITFEKNRTGILSRTIHGIVNVIRHKVIIFSGASKLDYLLIGLCKLLRKKTIYIMHGCIREENRINGIDRPDEVRIEMYYLKKVDLILGVSERFSEWLREQYPQYKNKIETLTNGVDWRITVPHVKKKSNVISAIGGGVPRKKIKVLCQAINEIDVLKNEKNVLKVFGIDGSDTESICAYPFVHYYGEVERESLFTELGETVLYVHNSMMDSFAMAPLEALMCGCSILCSKEVGALSLFQNLQENDVIQDYDDVQEIQRKIEYLLKNPNNERLMNGLDKDKTSFEYRAAELEARIQTMVSRE